MAVKTCTMCFARTISSSRALPRYGAFQRLSQTQMRPSKPLLRSFSVSATNFEKKFTKEHEWIELSSDGSIGTIGITEYAAHALGDVVYVELPAVDTECSAGDSIGAVESVKSASDIMTPVSGTVTEANSMLEESPGTINKSPEGEAWLAKIKLSDTKELDDLMDAAAYKSFTEEVKES